MEDFFSNRTLLGFVAEEIDDDDGNGDTDGDAEEKEVEPSYSAVCFLFFLSGVEREGKLGLGLGLGFMGLFLAERRFAGPLLAMAGKEGREITEGK